MRKLAWFSAGFAAACLWACYHRYGFPILLCAVALSAAVLCVWRFTRPRPDEPLISLRRPQKKGPLPRYALYQVSRRGLALCLGGLAALSWAGVYASLFRAPAEGWTGEKVELSGQVSSFPQATSIGGWSVTVRLDGGWTAPDVLLYGTADWEGLRPGDHIACTARVENSAQLYGDETTYYTARGVYLLAYCNQPPETVPAQSVPIRFWPALCAEKLRTGIDTAFDNTVAPLAAAITLGDRAGLDDQLYSALNRAGLMHAAVVSGLHISCLAGVVLWMCRGRRRAALAIIPFLFFYALMAGATPSAIRAVIMQTALLAAPVFRRENDGPSALGLALLLLLGQNPFAAASVSLQLSFASVAGILLASPALSRWFFRPLRGIRTRLVRSPARRLWPVIAFFVSGAAASLGAMLFTISLTALYFRRITLIAPLSGLLTLWALSLLMVCALVLGTLAIVLPGPAALLGSAAGLLGRYARQMALWLGRFPFASLSADNRYCLIWLGAVYLVLLLGWLGHNQPKQLIVPISALTLLLCAAICLGALEAAAADLIIAALDVGQGASTVLLSGGRAVLVDCGGSGSQNPGDTAADYFAALGRTRLDLLVLTHFDSDHVNGVEQLFHRMEVVRVAIPGGDVDPQAAARFTRLALAEGAEITVVDAMETVPLDCGTLTLFPPLGGGTSNESGLFVLCSAGEFDVLITGDADAFVENMLARYYPIPDIELLMVGHHGSDGSTCEAFLSAVLPELAVISVGRNSYGHPAAGVLDRLEGIGTQVWRTDLDGTVTVAVRDGAVGIS